MGLDEGDCEISFIGRGGMTIARLRHRADEILSRRPDVVLLEIGTNDIARINPIRLADEVFEFANLLTTGGVRHVIISQVFFRMAGRYHVAADFNDRVVVYNERMRELTRSSAVVDFWRHRGIWARWQDLLVDGVHFTVEGNRLYFKSVRGAIVAAVNKLH